MIKRSGKVENNKIDILSLTEDEGVQVLAQQIHKLLSTGSDLNTKFQNFEKQYLLLKDEQNQKNGLHYILSKQIQTQNFTEGIEQAQNFYKLKSIADIHESTMLKKYLTLWQSYEELTTAFLNQPTMTTVINIVDADGKHHLVEITDFSILDKLVEPRGYNKKGKALQTLTINKENMEILLKKAMDTTQKGCHLLENNIDELSNHYNFYYNRLHDWGLKKNSKYVPEAFYTHYFNLCKSLPDSLRVNSDEHFGGKGTMWKLYHQAQNNDPIYTGGDIMNSLQNISFKNYDYNKIGAYGGFDIASFSQVSNYYQFLLVLFKNCSNNKNNIDKFAKAIWDSFSRKPNNINLANKIYQQNVNDIIDILAKESLPAFYDPKKKNDKNIKNML